MSVDLTEAALALPEDERGMLAYRLLQSLKPATLLSEDSLEFGKVLEARVEAYERGQARASDWDVASARLRQALDDRKAK